MSKSKTNDRKKALDTVNEKPSYTHTIDDNHMPEIRYTNEIRQLFARNVNKSHKNKQTNENKRMRERKTEKKSLSANDELKDERHSANKKMPLTKSKDD